MTEFMALQLGTGIKGRTTAVALGSSFAHPNASGDYGDLPVAKRDARHAGGRGSAFSAANMELMGVLAT
jgi:hypothetical protein